VTEEIIYLEALINLILRQVLNYILILADIGLKVFLLQPSLHGITLYPLVSVLAKNALGYQGNKNAL
jgi:hypothetical protein